MEPIRAVGAMSGTSLDGVDAAEIVTDGETITAFGETRYRAYGEGERAKLRAALGQWPGAPEVAAAAQVVERAHADLLSPLEGALPFPDAQLIGFHGQTLAHDPDTRRTHQAGDGARLAETLGRAVVWDFRSADVGLGGQGAPLAPIFHRACARWIGATAPLAFLNLGGVGNLTWIDPAQDDPRAGLLAFDTGPANAPIDDLCVDWLGQPYDRDGHLAREGTPRADIVEGVMRHPYFLRMPPKSLDRDAFARAGAAIDDLLPSHAAATWVAIVARSVAAGLAHCPSPPRRILVCGGGRRNPAIMDALRAAVPCTVEPVEAVDLDGDMIEAQAFAYLAVRVARGLPTSFPTTTGVPAAVGGGILSVPDGVVAPSLAGARHRARRAIERSR